MNKFKKGDLLRYRDKYWSLEYDTFSYGILLKKDFVFETRPMRIREEGTSIRINQYTVYDFSMCTRLAISDDNYYIEKVSKKMNKK